MCKFCDASKEATNHIWVDDFTKDFFMEVDATPKNIGDKNENIVRLYGVQYCPYCGRKLYAYKRIEED